MAVVVVAAWIILCSCWWDDAYGWMMHLERPCSITTTARTITSSSSNSRTQMFRLSSTVDDDDDDGIRVTTVNQKKNKCSYKNLSTNRWKARQLLEDLKVGDALPDCYKIQELYHAKTGPKLFFECGIGRLDGKGKWQMVSGMLRLNELYSSYSKPSVIRKKAKKAFDNHRPVTLYVSKIAKDHGRLEVMVMESQQQRRKMKTSASRLKPGYEMEGTVVSVKPYGVFVDVGANRLGLLHIQTVADLYGHYIAKEKGLIQAGLELNARIRVAVQTNQRKRLALDFPSDIQPTKDNNNNNQHHHDDDDPTTTTTTTVQTSDNNNNNNNHMEDNNPYEDKDEAAMWAAYAADEYGDYEDDYEDEDRDIEDSLGLGTY